MTSIPQFITQLGSPAALRPMWALLKNVPSGGKMMGRLLGRMAPYTGTIRPEIVELSEGHAVLRMRDRKAVRNHLRSVHAIALMNLGEATTGAAMLFGLPDGMRGIPTRLSMDYLKKARGTLTAECNCEVPQSAEKRELQITADIKDKSGTVVARAHATWQVGPDTKR